MRTPEQKVEHAAYMREWNKKHRDLVLARLKANYEKNKTKINADKRHKYATDENYKRKVLDWKKEQYLRDRDKIIERVGQYTKTHREVVNERRRKEMAKLKDLAIAAYGGRCACCGETDRHFLSIDHVNGRKGESRSKALVGAKMYRWLKRKGYPKEEFRLLCMNCNFSYGMYGFCPHQKLARAVA
jgi:hypothetical protein